MEFLKNLSAVSPFPNLKLNRPLIEKSVKGDIGIEVELEGQLYSGEALMKYKSDYTGVSWITHRDDSLRNGVEYVLSRPCLEKEVKPLVYYLYETLQEQKSRIVLSNRTSTHVHINVQGFKPSELTSFICLWGLFEQAAVNYSGILRKCNQFCLTTKDTNGWLPMVWRDSLESGRFGWDNQVKYSALNLAAFSNFGSFEFRTMEGCSQPERVISWAQFLIRLRNTAVKYLPDEIGRGTSEKGPQGFLREICGDGMEEFVSAFCEATPAFDDVCIDSFRDYQELAFFVPWEKLRDEINRREIKRPFDEEKPTLKKRRIIEPQEGGFQAVPEGRGGRILFDAGLNEAELFQNMPPPYPAFTTNQNLAAAILREQRGQVEQNLAEQLAGGWNDPLFNAPPLQRDVPREHREEDE